MLTTSVILKEGTKKIYTHQKKSGPMGTTGAHTKPWAESDPAVDALVTEVIGRVADKWTMLILEVLADHGKLRFTQIRKQVPGVSQKMLTQTLRQMERDGLVVRTVFAIIPPRVEYRLTDLGFSLGAAFCGVWQWAEENLRRIEAARREFDERKIT